MQVVTNFIEKSEVLTALRNATAVSADEAEVLLDFNSGVVTIEQVLADLEYHIIRHPEIPFPVHKISVTFPEELQGKKKPREFFTSIHDVVCDVLPFGCMLASVQSTNKDVTIYVDGKPVIYHIYIEIFIIPPGDMVSGFELDLEKEIRMAALHKFGIQELPELEHIEPGCEVWEPSWDDD